ncbi:MAG: ThuA domain-containing protein, partial [Bacteroidota bacterium]|nr:ThuA domain-containing protein [Bacteroidota bacterium]
MKYFYLILFSFSILTFISCRQKRTGIPRVLVYTNTTKGDDASSIASAIQKLGDINGFQIVVTDTSSLFTDDSLANYAAVMFLNRTGLKLGYMERIALERFMQAGGGFAGIHAISKTYNWRWYGRMIGSDGDSCTSFIHQQYENGRASYTCDTVTAKKISDEVYLKNVLNEIEYAIGHFEPLDYSLATIPYPPSENHFTKHELVRDHFYEPTEMTILPNFDILVLQRRGEIMLYKQATGTVK